MSNAVSAFGTFLIWNYRKVLELTNISGPSESMDTIEVTSHDSSDSFKEFLNGPLSGGEITLEGNFASGDSGGQISFHTDLQAGTKRNCFLVMPMAVGDSLSFEAYAKGFALAYPYDSSLGVSGSLIVTGKPTLLTTQTTGISGLTGKKDGGTNSGDALTIAEEVAADTYTYTDTVDSDTTGVKLTVTAASHTIYVQGSAEESGVETDAISLGAAGTDTDIFIVVYETSKSPRLYTLTITRPAA